MKFDRNPEALRKRRDDLREECGIDAFYQPAEVWLSMAVAAEARGEIQTARDYEVAAYISNERRGPSS